MEKKSLSRDDIERLARICWENTGHEAPVVQPGEKLMFEGTGEEVTQDQLNPKWKNVGEWSKDIYRRQAAAVAVKLGFKLGADVKIRPREM